MGHDDSDKMFECLNEEGASWLWLDDGGHFLCREVGQVKVCCFVFFNRTNCTSIRAPER